MTDVPAKPYVSPVMRLGFIDVVKIWSLAESLYNYFEGAPYPNHTPWAMIDQPKKEEWFAYAQIVAFDLLAKADAPTPWFREKKSQGESEN